MILGKKYASSCISRVFCVLYIGHPPLIVPKRGGCDPYGLPRAERSTDANLWQRIVFVD